MKVERVRRRCCVLVSQFGNIKWIDLLLSGDFIALEISTKLVWAAGADANTHL